MTYKRIFKIKDTALADAMAAEAKHFGIEFRAARSGGPNEFVIEGAAAQKRDIDMIVETVAEMEAEAARFLA